MKTCMLSIDVEEDLGTKEFYSIRKVNNILKIFENLDLRSTLFVTGDVIEKYHDLVVDWSQRHEIASHGYYHIPLNKLSFQERKIQLRNFKLIYEEYLGNMPKGFRAVQHTIDDVQMKLLEDFGYEYDSSVMPSYFPFRKYIGYNGKAPEEIYHPNLKNYRAEGNMRIFEIPVTGSLLGIPLSGTWIRNLGLGFYKTILSQRKPDFINFSIHSWDAINYQGPYANKSGDEFLKILFQTLSYIKRDYNILPGADILRSKR